MDSLTLGDTVYTIISTEDAILADSYFSNLSENYVLKYTGTNNGSLYITMFSVPEPTSSVLGLVGLTALTLRRRRK